jgi:hypothetical protein
LAEFDPNRIRAAVRARSSIDIIVLGPASFDYQGRKPGPDGVLALPGEVADGLLMSGKAVLTDAERTAFAAEGIVTL